MTHGVRHSDRFFSIHRIPNFHRVDATNLIEAVTFRQSCCRPSSPHRSCFALWTFKITFHPSDDSPSAWTISQGTTEFSNWWVHEVDVGSHQLSLLCGRWGFLIHFSFCSLVCAIKFFIIFMRWPQNFPAVSRVPHQLCRAISVQTVCRGWRLHLVSQFSANGKALRCATVLLWLSLLVQYATAIVNELVHTRARLKAGTLESNLAPIPTCRKSRPSQAHTLRSVAMF